MIFFLQVINQRKKFGASGGGETGTGGGLNSGSYGLSKKSLGARSVLEPYTYLFL